MYALVVPGSVLIFKGLGVFNSPQGRWSTWVLWRWLDSREGRPFGSHSVVPASLLMLGFCIATERFLLRPLVNQLPISPLRGHHRSPAFFIEGLAPLLFGNEPRPSTDLGVRDEPIEAILDATGMVVSRFDLLASRWGALVAVLALLFNTPVSGARCGRGRRSPGGAGASRIPLQHIWVIVWRLLRASSRFVAGTPVGAASRVQFALTFTALKGAAVLILGGFTSVLGAIVGGLIIGASRNWLKSTFPVPPGSFRRKFPAVSRAGSPCACSALFFSSGPRGCSASGTSIGFEERRRKAAMFYRETGQFKTSYAADQQLFPIRLGDRIAMAECCSSSPSSPCRCLPASTSSAILIPFPDPLPRWG